MRHLKIRSCIRILVISLLALTGACAHHTYVSRTAFYSAARVRPQAGLSAEDQARVDKHCPFGMPKPSADWDFGPTDLVARDGYVLLHSARDKIPLWVCEHVDAQQIQGGAERSNAFFPEPKLSPGRRSELVDYKNSGFDRGHQAPAADFKADDRLMDETFSLANMAPQWPNLNRKIWAHLEGLARDWIAQRGAAFIITGPLFFSPTEDDPQTATGLVNTEVIGPDSVAVPSHCYKIVIAKSSGGEWQSIAFVIPNIQKVQQENFPTYIVSIDWIQRHTGLNFMPDLNSADEDRLEQHASQMW